MASQLEAEFSYCEHTGTPELCELLAMVERGKTNLISHVAKDVMELHGSLPEPVAKIQTNGAVEIIDILAEVDLDLDNNIPEQERCLPCPLRDVCLFYDLR